LLRHAMRHRPGFPTAERGRRYDTYGRFPGGTDAMHLMWVMQAHHIDTDYYDRFFVPARTGRRMRHTWRPGTGDAGAAMIKVSSDGDAAPPGAMGPRV
jgi:hypothetical protein